jgi:hypothetical protein
VHDQPTSSSGFLLKPATDNPTALKNPAIFYKMYNAGLAAINMNRPQLCHDV